MAASWPRPRRAAPLSRPCSSPATNCGAAQQHPRPAGTARPARHPGGLQIGGDSRDIQIADNLIKGGNGAGIVLGSVDFQPRPTLRDVARFGAFLSLAPRPALAVNRFILADNDCLTIDPAAGPPPTRNHPNPLDPVSDGPVEDCRIAATASSAWAPAASPSPTGSCPRRSGRHRHRSPADRDEPHRPLHAPAARAAPAGVGRGRGLRRHRARARRRHHHPRQRINEVGTDHSSPIVGIYMLDGEAVAIQRNRLRDNGRIADLQNTTPVGRIGAIFLGPSGPASTWSRRSEEDQRAAGRHPRAHRRGQRRRRPRGPGAHRGRRRADGGPRQPVHRARQQQPAAASGPASRRRTASRSRAWRTTASPRARPPNPLTAFLDALGGAAVAILNLGVSNELYLQLLGLSGLGQIDAEQPGRQSPGDDVRLLANGNVQFNDNQVVLDNLAPP